MQLIMNGHGVVLTPSLKRRVARKLDKLWRRLPLVLDARVTCAAEKFRRTVRLTLRTRRRTFATVATAADLEAALDAAVDTVSRQVRDARDRRRRLARRPAPRPAAGHVA
jgi:ribosomal subunit interface protein